MQERRYGTVGEGIIEGKRKGGGQDGGGGSEGKAHAGEMTRRGSRNKRSSVPRGEGRGGREGRDRETV